MSVKSCLSKAGELNALRTLYNSIVADGKINTDDSGFFTCSADRERVSVLEELQDKYTYGWYIAEQSEAAQLRTLSNFMAYIEENYYE